MQLSNSTWKQAQEYFAQRDLVILPVGSLENHGSHLCLGTDAKVPQYLADQLETRLQAAFAPVMPFGCADHHTDFPGTVSIGTDGLYLVMSRVVQCLYQAGGRHFVFLNGHGGNDPALSQVGLEMSQKGALCCILDWWVLAGKLNEQWAGGHGAGEETAAMLAIDPSCVHMEYFQDPHPQDLSPELPYGRGVEVLCNGIGVPVPRKVATYASAGWYGPDHPTKATCQWGQEMLQATVDFCVDFIEKFERVPLKSATTAAEIL